MAHARVSDDYPENQPGHPAYVDPDAAGESTTDEPVDDTTVTDPEPDEPVEVEQLPDGEYVDGGSEVVEHEGTGEEMTGVEVPLGETAELTNDPAPAKKATAKKATAKAAAK